MSRPLRVRTSAARCASAARESSGRESVGADIGQERPQLRLPGIRELQDIVDEALHRRALVLLEETARAEAPRVMAYSVCETLSWSSRASRARSASTAAWVGLAGWSIRWVLARLWLPDARWR